MSIPIVVVIMGSIFTASQQEIEAQRKQRELDIQEQRVQDEALQAYLTQMSALLIDGLRNSEDDSEARILARARTASLLTRSDPEHKRRILAFLDDSRLIQRKDVQRSIDENTAQQELITIEGEEKDSAIRLWGVNLKEAPLKGRILVANNLRGVQLNGADLTDTNLTFTTMAHADLRDADLSGAKLRKAELRGADLRGADLSGADLSGADLTSVTGLVRDQIDQAVVDEETMLPSDL